jgi:hypothetical protein
LKIVKQKYHQHMMISVKDTGVGITEDQKETIFDRFVQGEPSLSKRYGGTGAGLALCRELCELMGGTLTLCSTVGEGAHFEVKIPISPLDPDAGSVVNRKVDFDGQVLLVCESLERSEHLSRRLDQLGLQVMTVNSPNEAIKSFMMTNIVLVIVEEDLAIQNRGGLMRELRNFIQDDEILPIFVIQHLQSEDALMGIGATAVLPPLFRASELVALIEPWKRQIDLEQQKSHRAFLVELGLEELETQEDDGQKSP